MEKKAQIFLLYVFLGIFLFVPVGLAHTEAGLTAASAIIIEQDEGKVLYRKNSRLRLPAASTAKILTAIIIIEELNLNDYVSVSKRAAGITPTKAYLTENAKYRVRDLLKCFLMSSANDAGVALAEAVAGTEIEFSRRMNRRAKALGAKNSFFLNATGLPEGNKRQNSTVYDLSLFMRKALTYPQLVKIMRIKEAVISGTDGKQIKLRNHNKFLWRKSDDLIGKTGYTRKAKHCFLGMFTKNGRNFIVVMLGSRKLWADLEYLIRKRY